MQKSVAAFSFAASIAALASFRSAPADDGVAFKFSKPPVNSMGITGMEDLRGKPIVIDFWGTH
jgi:hypothetical protein